MRRCILLLSMATNPYWIWSVLPCLLFEQLIIQQKHCLKIKLLLSRDDSELIKSGTF